VLALSSLPVNMPDLIGLFLYAQISTKLNLSILNYVGRTNMNE
jgi:hypothetical protein